MAAYPPPTLTAGPVAVWLLVALNLVSVLTDQRRRALYDRAAGTVVVPARYALERRRGLESASHGHHRNGNQLRLHGLIVPGQRM